ncbi:MAG: Rossmann fold nucleotide-binding protein [Myxococcaceae bacterium]|nr:Rossmann fold nucleotide-binding protein [Myxococcaceae bacterium]
MQSTSVPIRLLEPGPLGWPGLLSDLQVPPERLALQGELPAFSRAVAIVGTRRPDARAYAFAHALAGELAGAGCLVISGGALGIDTAAHRGALDAGGRTLAVLPTGLRQPYPQENQPLFQEILQSGALLAETAHEVPGFASTFLARNRLIAALASVVIVVQAPIKSGALSTAAHARKLGRPLMAVPYAPWEPLGAGCLTLLATGARVCRTSADVLSLAAPTGVKPPRHQSRRPKKAQSYPELDEDERGVIEALSTEVLSADELCERTGFSAPRVQRAVLMLLLSKVIQEVGCGRYARTACL